jgi:hypothetical protein
VIAQYHADYYQALLAAAAAVSPGTAEHQSWQRWLEVEQHKVRAALP